MYRHRAQTTADTVQLFCWSETVAPNERTGDKDRQTYRGLRAGLLALERDKYILWEANDNLWDIVIIEGWDRDQKIIMPMGDANRYFTEY
ncbi:hypothetical protein [Paenibacillus sp. F4]|uniref:hypothetical protein n=1 Tax=Paenibacillus sp. F4 TaxID=357385 RepID=UPI0011AFBF8B|nr:hypothetical protein [Paenibacillus sp. F4]